MSLPLSRSRSPPLSASLCRCARSLSLALCLSLLLQLPCVHQLLFHFYVASRVSFNFYFYFCMASVCSSWLSVCSSTSISLLYWLLHFTSLDYTSRTAIFFLSSCDLYSIFNGRSQEPLPTRLPRRGGVMKHTSDSATAATTVSRGGVAFATAATTASASGPCGRSTAGESVVSACDIRRWRMDSLAIELCSKAMFSRVCRFTNNASCLSVSFFKCAWSSRSATCLPTQVSMLLAPRAPDGLACAP